MDSKTHLNVLGCVDNPSPRYFEGKKKKMVHLEWIVIFPQRNSIQQ